MPCGGNRRRARHIGCLQGIQIKLTAWNHLHTVVAPIWTLLYAPHMNSPLSSCLDECPTAEAPSVLKKRPDAQGDESSDASWPSGIVVACRCAICLPHLL
jgi:hypothetical protein